MAKEEKLRRIDSSKTRDVSNAYTRIVKSSGSGTTGLAVHALNSSYHTGLLPWGRLDLSSSDLGDLVTRNYSDLTNRQHDLAGADHSSTGASQQLIQSDGASGVEWIDSSNDGRNDDVILRSGASKYLTLKGFTANDSANPTFNLVNGNTNETVTFTMNNANRQLTISGSGGTYMSFLLSSSEVQINRHVQMLKSMASQDYSGTGAGGILLDFEEGFADIPNLNVDTLTAKTFTAAVTQAFAGAMIVGKSVTTLSRDFVIPAKSSTGTLYVKSLPGLDNYRVFEPGDSLYARYVNFNAASTGSASFAQWLSGSGTGSVVTILDEDFESLTPPADPSDWKITGVGNTTGENAGAFSTFVDPTDATNVAFGPAFTSSASNYHAHWNGTGATTLANYSYSGKFYLDGANAADAGVGFTVLSKYCDGSPSDTYVRVRRYGTSGTNNFYVANHGYGSPDGGTSTSSFDPAVDTWYNFKIEIEDDGSQTDLRARFWAVGDAEPGTWDIDCYWSGVSRPQSGTFGFWGYNSNSGEVLYDDILVDSLGASASASVTTSGSEGIQIALVTLNNTSGTVTTLPTGFSLVGLVTSGTHRTYVYRNNSPSATALTFASTNSTRIHVAVATMVNITGSNVNLQINTQTTTASSFPGSTITFDPTENYRIIGAIAALHDTGLVESSFNYIDWDFNDLFDDGVSSLFMFRDGVAKDDIDTAPTFIPSESTTGLVLTIDVPSPSSDTGNDLSLGGVYLSVNSDNTTGVVTENDEQAWTVTTVNITENTNAVGKTLLKDVVVVDLGQWISGVTADGVWEVTTIDPGAYGPYSQIKMRASTDPSDYDIVLRTGYLGGLAKIEGGGNFGASDTTFGLWFADPDSTAAAELSNRKAAFKDIDFEIYDGSDKIFWIDPGAGINLLAGATLTEVHTQKRALTFTDATETYDSLTLFSSSSGTAFSQYGIIKVPERTSYDSQLWGISEAPGDKTAYLTLKAESGSDVSLFRLIAFDSGLTQLEATADVFTIAGEVNAGNPTGGDYLEISTAGRIVAHDSSGPAFLYLDMVSADVTDYDHDFRLGRFTNVGTADLNTTFYKGNETATIGARINHDGSANSALCVTGGNLGVGTSSPTTGKLHVVNDSNQRGLFVDNNNVTFTVAPIQVASTDNGTGYGPYMLLGRNLNSTTPAPAAITLFGSGNWSRTLWVADTGDLHIAIAAGQGITSSTKGSGVAVGTQTSSEAYKHIIDHVGREEWPDAAARIKTAATEAVHRFQYKMHRASYGDDAEVYQGVVLERGAGHYGMNRYDDPDSFPYGKSLNTANAIGDLIQALALAHERIDTIVAALPPGMIPTEL